MSLTIFLWANLIAQLLGLSFTFWNITTNKYPIVEIKSQRTAMISFVFGIGLAVWCFQLLFFA